MKKQILILLLLLALMLNACSGTENCTITQGDTVYRYRISGDTYTVTYPDGATYSMSWSGPIGTGGGSGSYYDSPRVDGDILTDILKENQARKKDPYQFVLCLLVVGLGVFYAAAPYAAWFISHGWRYENAEPSEAALAIARISGIVMIALGIIILFI